jgi:hypothetical protein
MLSNVAFTNREPLSPAMARCEGGAAHIDYLAGWLRRHGRTLVAMRSRFQIGLGHAMPPA